MDGVQDKVDIGTAATRMGITPEAVRKRIARGTLPATKQEGRWYVTLGTSNGYHPQDTGQDAGQDTGRNVQDTWQNDKDRLIQTLTDELEARRREVSELHVLLGQAQAALPAPKNRPWWRRWW